MASEVWNYFQINCVDENTAVCNLCLKKISRGGKSHTTSNLRKHLESQHPSCLGKKRKFEEQSTENGASTSGLMRVTASSVLPEDDIQCLNHGTNYVDLKTKPIYVRSSQQTLTSMFDRQTLFKPGDHRANDITLQIGKMICWDLQPFSIVEDKGFRALVNHLEPRYTIPSRNHFATKVIPEMYIKTKAKVVDLLTDSDYVSFTTDMWTSSSNDDYMSLTAHFVDSSYCLHHLALEVVPFPEISHTAENISTFITTVIRDWNLSDKVVAVLRDNARNLTLGLEKTGFSHLPCLAHTLQLVVKDGLLNAKLVTNLVGTCRRIVGSFKHSSQACKVLKKAQTLVGCKPHRLIQDEPTRWNSTLHMIDRLIEQQALVLASSDLKLSNQLTSSQWELMKQISNILQLFNKATFTVSSSSVCISEMIPIVNSIIQQLQVAPPSGLGLQGMVNDLLTSLRMRCGQVEETDLYTAATLLDPRFKGKVFSSKSLLDRAKTALEQEADKIALVLASDRADEKPVSKLILYIGIKKFYQYF